MKKLGTVNIQRHLIGDRIPVVKILGFSSVALLFGCGEEKGDYIAFRSVDACNSVLPGQCDAAYKLAEKEAKRTAMKYMLKSECMLDYGFDICVKDDDGIWSPRMVGFLTHKSKDNDFTQPLFVSQNPSLSVFGKVLMADGNVLYGSLGRIDGEYFSLNSVYQKPLPAVYPSVTKEENNTQATTNQTKDGSQQSTASSIASTAAQAYVVSKVVGEAGEYLTEREKTKRYNQCVNSGQTDCSRYGVASGTARIGNAGNINTYKSDSNSSARKTVFKKTYQSTPAKSTVSRGGFGSSGRSFGGFGG